MKESIGSTWIFGLVIGFTVIFSGFLVIALSYSRAYKLKNEVTSIIEKYEGITSKNISIINNYLKNSGYSTKGNCNKISKDSNDEYYIYGETNLENSSYEIAKENEEYYYCIRIPKYTNSECNVIIGVTVFFDFELPIFGNLTKFKVSGQTNEIYKAYANMKKNPSEKTDKKSRFTYSSKSQTCIYNP